MRKTAFIFAGIMATVIGNAYATGENTVTSKSYVDAMDATKQDAISAGTTGNVVIYDGVDKDTGQAQFNERGIYSGSATYTNNDADKLVTASVVKGIADTLESMTIADNKLTCYNQNEGCTLWQITSGTTSLASAGTFAPLTAPACLAYGETYQNSVSECCSGARKYDRSHNICGCNTIDDCPSGFSSCNPVKSQCES